MRQARFFAHSLVLCLVLAAASAAPVGGEPDKDPKIASRLGEARQLIEGKKPAAAIEKCDEVIAAFQARYGGSKEKVYCARTSAESLMMLLKAASEKSAAIVLSPAWAEAYFIRAYALVDLGQPGEAKAALQAALALSPFSSQYLCELGQIYLIEKDWAQARKTFADAEDNANVAPEDHKAIELARARRGVGYVLVELGVLDEAAQKYEQCLTTDPNDAKAKSELEYVRQRKARQKARSPH